MTTIQIRTKENIKKNAQAILSELGLDMSTAINMFLVQLNRKKGMPFPILTENGMTPGEEQEIIELSKEAKESDSTYLSAEELHDAIMSE